MRYLLLLSAVFCSYLLHAQKQDLILGKWLKTPKEDLIIEVYKLGDEYKGKITWSKDEENKKPVGFIILDRLQYNYKSDKWESGKIHDPNSGKTYNATASIKNDGTLEVMGYMGGLKFMGRKKYFKKAP